MLDFSVMLSYQKTVNTKAEFLKKKCSTIFAVLS